MKTIHPAIAEHVMEENEKLRGLLTQALEFTEANTCGGPDVAQLIAEMRAALSQQAEPDHVEDMRAMVEPDPAQDEREESVEALFEHYLQNAIDNAPEPLRRLGEHLSHVLDEDRWATAERLLNGAIVALTRRAQTEQQPVHDAVWEALQRMIESAELMGPHSREDARLVARYRDRYRLLAAPIAQTDPWAPSGADYDRAIHHNPDAKAWADLFVETFPGLADKHDLMIGWFANAMMAMHDHLARKPAPQDTVAVLEVWDAIGHDTGCNPGKDELLASLRHMAELATSEAAPQPEQSEWISVEDRLPEVAAGDEGEFIVCVYRSHNGESYSFSARFLNDYPLHTDYEDEPTLHSGWYDVKEHADYDGWYSPLIDEKSGDKVTHWMPMPAAPALAAQGESHE